MPLGNSMAHVWKAIVSLYVIIHILPIPYLIIILSRLNSQRADVVTKTVETIVLVNVATTAVKLVSG